MSAGAERGSSWAPIEEAVEEARTAIGSLRERLAAERSEVGRLRAELDAIARAGGDADETAALRAENAVLRSRLDEARRRLDGVISRLDAFDDESRQHE